MNTYFDTSAFVPLLIAEPRSDSFENLWNRTGRVLSTRLLFVEAVSAIERARRSGRISKNKSLAAVERLEQLWPEVLLIELNESLMLEASVVASRFGLRGFDAVHCAAACRMADKETIAASGDNRLNEAWSDLGLATFRADN